MYCWCQNTLKYRVIVLFLLCLVGRRRTDAFVAGGASVRASEIRREGSVALNSQVSERTVSTADLAREWAARNSDARDAMISPPSSPLSDSFSKPHPSASSSGLPATSMSDLGRVWAARNRDSDVINDASSTVSLSVSMDSVPVQSQSPAANGAAAFPVTESSTEPSRMDMVTSLDEKLPSDEDTETEPLFYSVTSFDRELRFDDETGRFYEASSSARGSSILESDKQISSPKRFASSHGGFEALQKELEDRNTVVEGEGQYAVADGELVDRLTSFEMNEATMAAMNELSENEELSDKERKILAEKIENLTKPRPYPLFLAEKAAEVVESSVKGLCKPFKGAKTKSTDLRPKTKSYKGYASGSSRDDKESIVVLGSGWGAASFLKEIDMDQYSVTVISPRNHFVFTPMLASASVGTVEYRSITQPIREINNRARFCEATATDVDPETQLVTCQSVICDGNSCDICEFTVRYDRLVITVGAQTNTFGIPGVREYCCFLKQVEDARRIRTAIVNCFERANLPGLSDEEREHDLTFAIIGAGPTGIEFASELRDFVEQDGPKYYPNLVKHVRIKILVSSSTILRPFDKSLQEEAIRQMNRAPRIDDPEVRRVLPARFKLTELLLESAVKEVTDREIVLKDDTKIPYGLAVWAAGNGPIPLTLHVIEGLGEDQAREQNVARGRIAVDPWLRAVGGKGKILAFGDCSCICQGGQQLAATAQVASQQGEYLASKMNRKFDWCPPTSSAFSEKGVLPPPMRDPTRRLRLSERIAGISTKNVEYAKPFQFLNLGILAYTGGGSALAQVETAPEIPPVLSSGSLGNLLWRSVYLGKQVSWRNRLLVLNDWTKKQLFGRDITRV